MVKEGNQNTRFFHANANCMQKSNFRHRSGNRFSLILIRLRCRLSSTWQNGILKRLGGFLVDWLSEQSKVLVERPFP